MSLHLVGAVGGLQVGKFIFTVSYVGLLKGTPDGSETCPDILYPEKLAGNPFMLVLNELEVSGVAVEFPYNL